MSNFPFTDSELLACLQADHKARYASGESIADIIRSLDVDEFELTAVELAIDSQVEYNESHEDSLSSHDSLVIEGYRKPAYAEYLKGKGIPDSLLSKAQDDLLRHAWNLEWFTGYVIAREEDSIACFPFGEHEFQFDLSEFSPLQWWYAEYVTRECLHFGANDVLAYRGSDAMACCRIPDETVTDWLESQESDSDE